MKLTKAEFIPGLVTTAIPPVVGLTYYIVIFLQILNGGGSNDAVGWTLLFWMMIGVLAVPAALCSGIPCLIYFADRKRDYFFHTAISMIKICNVIVLVALFLLGIMSDNDSNNVGIFVAIGIIYFVLSLYSVSAIMQARDRISSENQEL